MPFLLLLLCLISFDSHALVNMRNGNYSQSWTDILREGVSTDLTVRRIYNSRTTFSGMFGRGWCTPLETRLDVLPDGTLRITECGAGDQTLYRPDASRQAGAFYGRGKEFESLIKTETGYLLTHQDRFQQLFDTEGRMVRMQDPNGNFSELEYLDGKLVHIGWSNKRWLDFIYGENGKVAQAKSSVGQQASYRYDGDLLVSSKNAWRNEYTYAYDARHRMTRADWPDHSFVTIEYDTRHNWVTQFKRRNGCVERYQYQKVDNNHDATKLFRTYPDDDKQQEASEQPDAPAAEAKPASSSPASEEPVALFDYWYAINAQGERYLERIQSNLLGNTRDVHYHGTYRLPLSIKEHGEENRYEYYPSGLVKSRSTKYIDLSYEYARGKISKVVMRAHDEAGNPVKELRTSFTYDEHANLKWAENSDGQNLEIGYDRFGNIIKIRDQAKRTITLTHDKRCNKPETIRRKGLGSVTVRYNANCEIDKVDSKETPAVAMQISSSFNNLLEMISPATEEMYP